MRNLFASAWPTDTLTNERDTEHQSKTRRIRIRDGETEKKAEREGDRRRSRREDDVMHADVSKERKSRRLETETTDVERQRGSG